MKPFLLPLFLALSFSTLLAEPSADITLKKTAEWTLTAPAYGQVRAVAKPWTLPGLGSEAGQTVDWDGPWSQYDGFHIVFDWRKSTQLAPQHFDFFSPYITLHGSKKGSAESYSFGVALFDGPSTPQDIECELYPIEGTPKLETSYKIATLFSKLNATRWDIYVRFTATKPPYVR